MEPQVEPVRVLFEGRYRKLVRDLPQTIFFCPQCKGRGCTRCEGFGRLTRDSVQDLIARVAMPRFKARKNKFHGAGREDMDVRMLGSGRPFVFEMQKAKRPDADLGDLQDEINRRWEGRIEVLDLKLCDRSRVIEIKETHCEKEYRSRVRFAEPQDPERIAAVLQELQERGTIQLLQGTPARVAHRRANLDRERWIQVSDWSHDGDDWVIDIRSKHGTYIKEAVSGDENRTRPSLASLFDAPCSCVELDVLEIREPEQVD